MVHLSVSLQQPLGYIMYYEIDPTDFKRSMSSSLIYEWAWEWVQAVISNPWLPKRPWVIFRNPMFPVIKVWKNESLFHTISVPSYSLMCKTDYRIPFWRKEGEPGWPLRWAGQAEPEEMQEQIAHNTTGWCNLVTLNVAIWTLHYPVAPMGGHPPRSAKVLQIPPLLLLFSALNLFVPEALTIYRYRCLGSSKKGVEMIPWPDSLLSRTTKRAPEYPSVITVLE